MSSIFFYVRLTHAYTKDPENPKRWIVLEEAAAVRRIYKLCIDGMSECAGGGGGSKQHYD